MLSFLDPFADAIRSLGYPFTCLVLSETLVLAVLCRASSLPRVGRLLALGISTLVFLACLKSEWWVAADSVTQASQTRLPIAAYLAIPSLIQGSLALSAFPDFIAVMAKFGVVILSTVSSLVLIGIGGLLFGKRRRSPYDYTNTTVEDEYEAQPQVVVIERHHYIGGLAAGAAAGVIAGAVIEEIEGDEDDED